MPFRSPVARRKTGDGGTRQNAPAADRLHLSLYLYCAGFSYRDADAGDDTVSDPRAELDFSAAIDGDAKSIPGSSAVAHLCAKRVHAREIAVHPRLNTHRIRLLRVCGILGRLRGLLCRYRPPGPRTGLWIVPCWAVHTMGMRYPIDVAFIGHDGRVQRLVRHVRPGRIVFCLGAASVIELTVNDTDTSLRYRRRLHLALHKFRSRDP